VSAAAPPLPAAELPRPVRLNNPGDLERVEGMIWLGESEEQPDPRFVCFRTPAYGFRALAIDLRTGFTAHGRRTVTALITPFAPPTENDTAAYIDDVAKRLGVGPDDPIDVYDYATLLGLCMGIAVQEGGGRYFIAQEAIDGMAMMGIVPAAAPKEQP
jgi:hypothetical protein